MIHTTSLPISFASYRVERKGGRREVGKDVLLQGLIWKKTLISCILVEYFKRFLIYCCISLIVTSYNMFCNRIYNHQPIGILNGLKYVFSKWVDVTNYNHRIISCLHVSITIDAFVDKEVFLNHFHQRCPYAVCLGFVWPQRPASHASLQTRATMQRPSRSRCSRMLATQDLMPRNHTLEKDGTR